MKRQVGLPELAALALVSTGAFGCASPHNLLRASAYQAADHLHFLAAQQQGGHAERPLQLFVPPFEVRMTLDSRAALLEGMEEGITKPTEIEAALAWRFAEDLRARGHTVVDDPKRATHLVHGSWKEHPGYEEHSVLDIRVVDVKSNRQVSRFYRLYRERLGTDLTALEFLGWTAVAIGGLVLITAVVVGLLEMLARSHNSESLFF